MGHQPVCPRPDQISDSVQISNRVRKVHVVVWLCGCHRSGEVKYPPRLD